MPGRYLGFAGGSGRRVEHTALLLSPRSLGGGVLPALPHGNEDAAPEDQGNGLVAEVGAFVPDAGPGRDRSSVRLRQSQEEPGRLHGVFPAQSSLGLPGL